MRYIILVNIGYGNSVLKEHVIGLLKNEGAALRRYRSVVKDSCKLVDATSGHKTRSIIIAETLAERFNKTENSQE